MSNSNKNVETDLFVMFLICSQGQVINIYIIGFHFFQKLLERLRLNRMSNTQLIFLHDSFNFKNLKTKK